MCAKILYEKHYDVTNLLEFMNAPEPIDNGHETSKAKKDIISEIYKDITYVPLPDRKESATAFVNKAIKVSELYEVDVKISEHESHISADYFLYCGCSIARLKDVFRYADDISFFSNIHGYDIVISIDHYTHAVCRKGKQILP